MHTLSATVKEKRDKHITRRQAKEVNATATALVQSASATIAAKSVRPFDEQFCATASGDSLTQTMSLALRQTLRSRPYPTSSVLARRKLTTSSRRCSEHQPRQHTSHGQFYSDLLPGMIPITLLGSAVYIVRPLLSLRQDISCKPELCLLTTSSVLGPSSPSISPITRKIPGRGASAYRPTRGRAGYPTNVP